MVARSPSQCRHHEPLTWPVCRGPASGPSQRCLPLGSAPLTLLPRGTRATGPWAGQEPRGGLATSVPSSGPMPATGTPPLPGLGGRGLQDLSPTLPVPCALGSQGSRPQRGRGFPQAAAGGPGRWQVPHPGRVWGLLCGVSDPLDGRLVSGTGGGDGFVKAPSWDPQSQARAVHAPRVPPAEGQEQEEAGAVTGRLRGTCEAAGLKAAVSPWGCGRVS